MRKTIRWSHPSYLNTLFSHLSLKVANRFCTIMLCLVFFIIPVSNANKTVTDSGMIDPVTFEAPLYKELHATFLIESFRGDHFNQQTSMVYSPGIQFPLNKSKSLHALIGYSRVNIYPPNPNIHQNSNYQELTYSKTIDKYIIANSVRLEEIWATGNLESPVLRAWHRFYLAHALFHSRYRLMLSNELRYNLTGSQNGPEAGLQQNRTFIGVGRCLNLKLCGRAGYMLQYLPGQHGQPNQISHLLFLGAQINFGVPAHFPFPPGTQ